MKTGKKSLWLALLVGVVALFVVFGWFEGTSLILACVAIGVT